MFRQLYEGRWSDRAAGWLKELVDVSKVLLAYLVSLAVVGVLIAAYFVA